MLLQVQVVQPLAGVERTRTEGRCSWGWASGQLSDEGFFMRALGKMLNFKAKSNIRFFDSMPF